MAQKNIEEEERQRHFDMVTGEKQALMDPTKRELDEGERRMKAQKNRMIQIRSLEEIENDIS